MAFSVEISYPIPMLYQTLP
ncbi:BnaA01g05200D [Brassica napus]|uniref:BnaA01g05200D protein n=1 Tax=Brassica napus TaxID=3708 RepID=A0A078HYZ5_BRANA|nr:BnaA01g05200D [Brassica napus]